MLIDIAIFTSKVSILMVFFSQVMKKQCEFLMMLSNNTSEKKNIWINNVIVDHRLIFVSVLFLFSLNIFFITQKIKVLVELIFFKIHVHVLDNNYYSVQIADG